MTAFTQTVMFLSSYAPLAAVFALLGTFGSTAPVLGVLSAIVVFGTALPWIVMWRIRTVHPTTFTAVTARPRTEDAVAYVATYLVPFAALVASTARERAALGLFVAVIAILYVRAELFFVNPILAIAGYRIFDVEGPSGSTLVLIAKRRFMGSGTEVAARRLGGYVYWESK